MNLKPAIFPFLIILMIASGCSKEENDFRYPELGVPVIHGFWLRDEVGITMGSLGYSTPNVKLGDQSDDFSSPFFFYFYPNPIHNFLSIYSKIPSGDLPRKFWITHALFRPPGFTAIPQMDGMGNMVAGGFPLVYGEFTGNHMFLNLSELPDGYYRVYLKVQGQIFYDNLVIDRNFNPYQ